MSVQDTRPRFTSSSRSQVHSSQAISVCVALSVMTGAWVSMTSMVWMPMSMAVLPQLSTAVAVHWRSMV